jgi:hypothetical protein
MRSLKSLERNVEEMEMRKFVARFVAVLVLALAVTTVAPSVASAGVPCSAAGIGGIKYNWPSNWTGGTTWLSFGLNKLAQGSIGNCSFDYLLYAQTGNGAPFDARSLQIRYWICGIGPYYAPVGGPLNQDGSGSYTVETGMHSYGGCGPQADTLNNEVISDYTIYGSNPPAYMYWFPYYNYK